MYSCSMNTKHCLLVIALLLSGTSAFSQKCESIHPDSAKRHAFLVAAGLGYSNKPITYYTTGGGFRITATPSFKAGWFLMDQLCLGADFTSYIFRKQEIGGHSLSGSEAISAGTFARLYVFRRIYFEGGLQYCNFSPRDNNNNIAGKYATHVSVGSGFYHKFGGKKLNSNLFYSFDAKIQGPVFGTYYSQIFFSTGASLGWFFSVKKKPGKLIF